MESFRKASIKWRRFHGREKQGPSWLSVGCVPKIFPNSLPNSLGLKIFPALAACSVKWPQIFAQENFRAHTVAYAVPSELL